MTVKKTKTKICIYKLKKYMYKNCPIFYCSRFPKDMKDTVLVSTAFWGTIQREVFSILGRVFNKGSVFTSGTCFVNPGKCFESWEVLFNSEKCVRSILFEPPY